MFWAVVGPAVGGSATLGGLIFFIIRCAEDLIGDCS